MWGLATDARGQVTVLVAFEILVFPILCGWMLDAATLAALGSRWADRLTLLAELPIASMAIHWYVRSLGQCGRLFAPQTHDSVRVSGARGWVGGCVVRAARRRASCGAARRLSFFCSVSVVTSESEPRALPA